MNPNQTSNLENPVNFVAINKILFVLKINYNTINDIAFKLVPQSY